MIELFRNIALLSSFVMLIYVFFRKKQDTKLNWSIFFSSLWVSLSLFIINYISVKSGYWSFATSEFSGLLIPPDIFFTWVIIWGVLLPFIFKGKYIFVTCALILWIDILFMPLLDSYGIVRLNTDWLKGEWLMLLFVLLPSQYWVQLYIKGKHPGRRSFFQFLCVAMLYAFIAPFSIYQYFPNDLSYTGWNKPILIQVGFIFLLPGLIAVVDLVEHGIGTPFPYDPTQRLVRTGVYAYIKNPIQWSLTLIFIPIAIFFHSYLMLLGLLISIAYTISIANYNEYRDMENRFGKAWLKYQKNTPSWYFALYPTNIPTATIYFQKDCLECSRMRQWIERRKPHHLTFRHASEFPGVTIEQVTLIDHQGNRHTSVKAIAHAFNHLHLGWASLGWLMRLPVIAHLLQIIVNGLGLRSIASNKCPSR